MAVKSFLPLIGVLGLAACGGGGGTIGTGVDLNAGPGSFADLDVETDRLRSYLSSPQTDDANLPTSNSVNYDGVIYLGEDLTLPVVSAQAYLGQVDITVDFTSGSRSTTGTANNFYEVNTDANGFPDSSAGAVPGELALSGGNFTDNNGFSLSVTSTTDLDGNAVSGSLLAIFASTASNNGPVAILAQDDGGSNTVSVGGTNYDASLFAD